jgi:cyclopropane fatty-acyl-phospholipid synthase-like methyltransferase
MTIKNHYYNAVRHDVISIIPSRPFKNILEIGGGKSNTLKALLKIYSAKGWAVDLIQTNQKGFTSIQGSIENKKITDKIPNHFFDLIVACDVIEHLMDTDNFFDMMHQKLNKNGLLVLSVPNIRQIRTLYHLFVRGSFPRENAGLFDKTHLRWFCKKDVVNFARHHGFEIADSKSVGKLVPRLFDQTIIGEFLALQNIFVLNKK